MVVGYSLLEGVGSALMIPPVYILITVVCADVKTRAKYLGRIPTWSTMSLDRRSDDADEPPKGRTGHPHRR
jgi:hypothetical protein